MKEIRTSGHCPSRPLSSTDVSAPDHGAPSGLSGRPAVPVYIAGSCSQFGELLLGEPPQLRPRSTRRVLLSTSHGLKVYPGVVGHPPMRRGRSCRRAKFTSTLHFLSCPILAKSQAHPGCSGNTCE